MKILLLIVCLITSVAALAKKDTVIVYYNSAEQPVKKRDFYNSYRKYFAQASGTYGFLEFDNAGRLKMSGAYESDAKHAFKTGLFTYYNKTGIKIKEEHYKYNRKDGSCHTWFDSGALQSEGYFLNDAQSGEWKGWYENGTPSYHGIYVLGKCHGVWTRWYKDGTKSSIENYILGQNNGACQRWFKNGSLDQKGNYVSGKRDSIWTFYFESGAVSAIENYEDGKAISIEFWDENGNSVTPPLSGELEKDPEFNGGEMEMIRFIQQHVQYPELAREMGEEGTVYIRFIVTKDGTLSEFEVFKSVSYLLDNESLRVIKLMPPWIPGFSHNRMLDVAFLLPIKFAIA